MNRRLAEIAGWYGVAAIILAYAFVSFKVVMADSYVYQLLNLSGGLGILWISIVRQIKQTAVTNIFWALIALVAIIQLLFR